MRVLSSCLPVNMNEPRAYLTTIARNLLIDHWRRQELERAYEQAMQQLPEALAPSPEVRLQMLETLVELDQRLQALPELTRQVFFHSQLDGMRYADIATELQMSLATVKRHMSRAFLACMGVA